MMLFLMIVGDLAVFALVAAGVTLLSHRIDTAFTVRRRVRGEAAPAHAFLAPTSVVLRQESGNPVLAWVQETSSLNDPKERKKLRLDLFQAGFRSASAPALYVVIRFGLALTLPALFMVAQKFSDKPATGMKLILIPLLLSGIALIAPRAFIDNRAGARRSQLEQQFPDALDLMVVCVEAGLGLEAAFIRVGEETKDSHPRISEEFLQVSQEMRAGRSREEALRTLADRAQVDMVKSFVALLIQTDALGVSIAQSLRTYAQEMRQHRMLKAEEKAMRIPVLMTAPIILCILPVIVTAVMLPAIIDMYRNLLPALGSR